MSQSLKGEHIYVDALVVSGNSSKLAYYNQTFNESILKSGSKYALSIDRFRIPMDDIHIFDYQYTAVENPITHTTIYVEDQYSVELSYNSIYGGRTYTTFIPTTTTHTKDDPTYWKVWTFDSFILMVNKTIARAFAKLAGLVTFVGAQPPFFTLDSTTHELSLNAQVDFYDSALLQPIKLYLNQNLYNFFTGIPISVVGSLYHMGDPSGRDVLYIPFNTYTNVWTFGTAPYNTYYRMASDNGIEAITSWNVAKGFYFRSNNIPVRYEILPNNSLTTSGQPLINNNVSSQPIICNFDFAYTGSAPKPLVAQYVLQTPYKVIDIIAPESMRTLDIQVFWYDKYNVSYPLIIAPNDAMSIRLVFQEK